MGAFDIYSGEASCPRCGDRFWLDGQTKFFGPEFYGLCNRWFRSGDPQPLEPGSEAIGTARAWEGSWWRVREPVDPTVVQLLVDEDEWFGCDCGARFAVILRLRVGEGPSTTLESILLGDAYDREVAGEVDFANGESMLWAGDHAAFVAALQAVAAEPPEARAARLCAFMTESWDRRCASEPEDGSSPWTHVAGEFQCEACGDRRERSEMLLLSHPDYAQSFFGSAWTGGTLRPGCRIAGEVAWLEEDVDRGYYTRLRHPVTRGGLTLIGRRGDRGCRCGAGRAAPVLRFVRDAGGLTLAALSLRVVASEADLDDVDFAEAPHSTRDRAANAPPLREAWDRAQVRRAVFKQFIC
ncbi:hypothetical protein [Nannocystis bainbridge]|uniref:Uncharacterized protein n=1 Tax=Nannocystis bainbridge TaxID=2995303 RepID=A0ABT5DWD1_9BACT|nr:hypothetical protein [Nannocystis bainbridge]MDC0717870.1 hypothetical protein [Nannocystis bainbridge]